MTVMVTGASGLVGHALIPLLVPKDEVRAAVRRPEMAEPLRAMGAKVTIGRLDDADALVEVLKRVHTVFHLVGGPNQLTEEDLWDANHGSVLRALNASKEAGVQRFVFVSVPGASPDASDPFLRAKGMAEEAVVTSGLEHAVVRCTHLYGLGGLWFTALVQGALASPPTVIGQGDADVCPVLADDLAAVLAAIDDRADRIEGTWALAGPDAVSIDRLINDLTGDAAEPRHVSGAQARIWLEALLGIRVSAAAVRWLETPGASRLPDAAAAFGVARTPLAVGLRLVLDRAAPVNRG